MREPNELIEILSQKSNKSTFGLSLLWTKWGNPHFQSNKSISSFDLLIIRARGDSHRPS